MSDTSMPDYELLRKQFNELKQATDNIVSRMSTLAALLHSTMNKNSWTGFYQLDNHELIVGPFQGPIACLKLKRDTGVCWTSANQKQTIVVENVHEFPGHIACDSKSCSEIVVPCLDSQGNVYAVLDIDSYDYSAFNADDAKGLELIVSELNS